MKWYGKIGFRETQQTEPGVWEPVLKERDYYGDVLSFNRRLTASNEGSNDNLTVSNQISIVADPYANEHFFQMLYIEFQGSVWTVSNVDVQYPRLVLSLGGLYEGEREQDGTSGNP